MRHVSQAPVDNKTHGTAVDDTCDPEEAAWSPQRTPNRPSEGRFTKQFVRIAAKILGSGRTVFESMEAVEAANERSQWAPFRNEEEWELARFSYIFI